MVHRQWHVRNSKDLHNKHGTSHPRTSSNSVNRSTVTVQAVIRTEAGCHQTTTTLTLHKDPDRHSIMDLLLLLTGTGTVIPMDLPVWGWA